MQIGKSRMVRTESRHNAILPIRQIDTHRKGIVFRNKGTCSRRGGCGGATARTQREATSRTGTAGNRQKDAPIQGIRGKTQ